MLSLRQLYGTNKTQKERGCHISWVLTINKLSKWNFFTEEVEKPDKNDAQMPILKGCTNSSSMYLSGAWYS